MGEQGLVDLSERRAQRKTRAVGSPVGGLPAVLDSHAAVAVVCEAAGLVDVHGDRIEWTGDPVGLEIEVGMAPDDRRWAFTNGYYEAVLDYGAPTVVLVAAIAAAMSWVGSMAGDRS